jgi:hypothetical protein
LAFLHDQLLYHLSYDSIISDFTRPDKHAPAINAQSISITNIESHPVFEMKPVTNGKAAPSDPVPSIIDVTVANARESPLRDL